MSVPSKTLWIISDVIGINNRPFGGFKQIKQKGGTMLSFDNWLATKQGGFFQHKFDVKHQLTESELRKLYFIFKKKKFETPRGVMIKECWHLQNPDGSLGIPND